MSLSPDRYPLAVIEFNARSLACVRVRERNSRRGGRIVTQSEKCHPPECARPLSSSSPRELRCLLLASLIAANLSEIRILNRNYNIGSEMACHLLAGVTLFESLLFFQG